MLSPNQQAAIGTTCKTCQVGQYERRYGQYGEYVKCNRWPSCKGKIYKPRGAYVKAQREGQEYHGPPQATQSKLDLSTVDLSKLESEVKAIATDMLSAEKQSLNRKLDTLQGKLDKLESLTTITYQIKIGETTIKLEGEHFLLPRAIRLIKAQFNVYAYGDAGTGKTTGAQRAFMHLGVDSEIDTLDRSTFRSMIQGYMTPTGEPVHTSFTRCWLNGLGYIADELDNSPGHVQTLFNSALANGHAALAWGNAPRKEGFGFYGTGNTPGRPTRSFPDRVPMSEAFKDRLYFLHWPLDEAIECRAGGVPIPYYKAVVTEKKVNAGDWVTWVQLARKYANKNMPTLIITPRASLAGLQALAIGESPEEVADGLVFRGCDNEMRSKVLHAVPLP